MQPGFVQWWRRFGRRLQLLTVAGAPWCPADCGHHYGRVLRLSYSVLLERELECFELVVHSFELFCGNRQLDCWSVDLLRLGCYDCERQFSRRVELDGWVERVGILQLQRRIMGGPVFADLCCDCSSFLPQRPSMEWLPVRGRTLQE